MKTAPQLPLPERIEEILEKAALSYDHKDCDPTECAGHSRYKDATHQINALLTEEVTKAVLKQAVRHAAEQSILDQEITSLKAKLKQLNKEK